jgi:hypothetical protein
MKKRIIEWLIKLWLPKYKLARIRGPYRKKPEILHMGKDFIAPPPEFSTEDHGKEEV